MQERKLLLPHSRCLVCVSEVWWRKLPRKSTDSVLVKALERQEAFHAWIAPTVLIFKVLSLQFSFIINQTKYNIEAGAFSSFMVT